MVVFNSYYDVTHVLKEGVEVGSFSRGPFPVIVYNRFVN